MTVVSYKLLIVSPNPQLAQCLNKGSPVRTHKGVLKSTWKRSCWWALCQCVAWKVSWSEPCWNTLLCLPWNLSGIYCDVSASDVGHGKQSFIVMWERTSRRHCSREKKGKTLKKGSDSSAEITCWTHCAQLKYWLCHTLGPLWIKAAIHDLYI